MEARKELDSLDAYIAEKVMGIVWDEKRCRICGWPLANSTDEGCVLNNCARRSRVQMRADEPAPYSTDLNWAWAVVERLRKRGCAVVIEASPVSEKKFVVKFVFHGGHSVAQAQDDTVPLAICLAALEVMR